MNTNNPLVSIIVPCYNMGDKIHRLFDSLLVQTYKHFEIVLVDDGSKDNSKEIVNSYIPKFKKIGVKLNYVYKDNGGLGSAINTGLKHVNGDFLCWPDADDFLTPDSIEVKLQFLLDHPDYGLVRSDAYLLNENDLSTPIGTVTGGRPSRTRETGFMRDYILENDVIFCSGCHMVRVSALKSVNPDLEIYEAKRGQNFQMLLPMVYKYKFGYIDKCLYYYVIYANSMSRGDTTYEKTLDRIEGINTIITETLKRIDFQGNDKEYYTQLAGQRYIFKRAECALMFNRFEEFEEFYKQLTDKEMLKQMKSRRLVSRFPALYKLVRKLKK